MLTETTPEFKVIASDVLAIIRSKIERMDANAKLDVLTELSGELDDMCDAAWDELLDGEDDE